jgi:hypothetical protein
MEEMKKVEETKEVEIVVEKKRLGRPAGIKNKIEDKTEEVVLKEDQKPAKIRPSWEKNKEKDFRMIRGVFKNEVSPGKSLKFYYKKYSGPILTFEFEDGHAYTIPYMVAKHLHENCYIPIHERSQDEEGRPLTVIGKKIKQYDFISPDIIEEPDASKKLITIQRGY